MRDPVRLLDGHASDAERALLLAGANEDPPPDGALRVAAALGVSAGLLGAANAAASSVPAKAGAAASASTPPAAAAAAAPLAAGLALKWLALAGGAAAIAAAVLVMRGESTPQQRDARPAAERRQPDVQAQVPIAAPQAAQPLPAQRPAAREASAPQRPEAAPVRSKSIAREIEQLDAARYRLQRGQARAALAVLDAYRREHATGVLGQEAALLRIEALVHAGERATARRKAERFLRDNPASPHEDRIRALLGDLDAR